MKHEEEIYITEGAKSTGKGGKTPKRNKDGTPRKEGSGRLAGSYSMALTTLGDLKALFASDEAIVTVGRKWAEGVGLKVKQSSPSNKLMDKIEGTTPTTAPKVRIEEL